MLSLKVPPFDLLVGQPDPYSGFGSLVLNSTDLEKQFLTQADNALNRLNDGFDKNISISDTLPSKMDSIVNEMWDHGWSPNKGNINLFVTDFGLVLTTMLYHKYHGLLVFRSENDISHVSLYWRHRTSEAFPFHHVLKCFLERNTNSIATFVKGVENILAQ